MHRNSSSSHHTNRFKNRYTVEPAENIDTGGRILYVRLCTAPLWKTLLRYLIYICTAFTFYLINLWLPSVFVFMSLEDSDINDAKKVVVYGADKHIEVVPFIVETTSKQNMKVFYYRFFKYYYDEEAKIFKACKFDIKGFTCNEIYKYFENGLSDQTVRENATVYGKNLTDIPRKSCLELLIQEVLSPFYVFQVYSFTIWFIDYYYIYTIMLIIFSVISITITLYETMRTTNKLRKMSHYEITVHAHRKIEGRIIRFQIVSSELVPGDLIEIPESVLMPCDAILLKGSCVMNESMLTGESIPVLKSSLPANEVHYNPREDKQYTLFAGTKCIQAKSTDKGPALGLVVSTGFSTVKGELIRTMMYPKPSDFKFYTDSLKFVSGLAVLALIGFIIVLPSLLEVNEGESLIVLIIVKGSEILTVAVPPALPTCIQIGITISLSRLKKNKIFCISPNKINEAARVNIMCFDKTGTLTEDNLDLLGVQPVAYEEEANKTSFAKLVKEVERLTSAKLEPEVDGKGPKSPGLALSPDWIQSKKTYSSEQLLEIMATCHSLTNIDGALIGDPLDIKMFGATGWVIDENDAQRRDNSVLVTIKPSSKGYKKDLKGVDVMRRFEFSSSLQRMSVVVREVGGTGLRIHIKGSPEKIQELCRPETIPENYLKTLQQYTQNGYRVLACGTKAIEDGINRVMTGQRVDIEKNFAFAGFLIMENKLKMATTETIDVIQAAQIRTIMVTGDNVLTAISVARQCHMIGQNQKIFLGDVTETNQKKTIVWKDFDATGRSAELDFQYKAKALDYVAGMASNENGIDESLIVEKPGKRKENLLSNSFHHDSAVVELRNVDLQVYQKPDSVLSQTEVPFLNLSDYDDYCIAVTGKAFSLLVSEVEITKSPLYQAVLQKLLKKGVVFARMHPDEKADMIKRFQTLPKTVVGMCGDGANDVGALKTANVGISLSEAEASIAAPFTSNIQDISCVPTLLREGKAALSTSYQEFKYMALFAIIMFAGMTLLYYHLMDFTDWDYYYIEIFIVLPLSSTMGMSETYSQLSVYKPSDRLISVEILSSVIGQGIIQAFFQFTTFFLMRRQHWYDESQCADQFDTGLACVENTSLYIVTNFQYCLTAFVFMVGKPFKKPFYTNFWFTFSFVFMMILNVLMTYNPFNWQFLYDQDNFAAEVPLPPGWKNDLMIIIIINSVFTIVWEEVAVKHISLSWRRYKSRKNKFNSAGRRAYEPPMSLEPASHNNLNNNTVSEPYKFS